MYIDCHLHSRRYSPCSLLAPEQALDQALHKGLQAVVITEHQIQWSSKEVQELQKHFPDIAIYSGLEITLAEEVDLVLITPNQALKFPFGISFNALRNKLDHVWEQSFAFLAHAFRWTGRLSPQAEKILPYLHGLEMNSLNILNGQYQESQGKFKPKLEAAYQALRKKYNLVPVYNSDAHLKQAVGSIANYISCPAPPEDEASLASLLKSTKPQEHQDRQLLRDLLS